MPAPRSATTVDHQSTGNRSMKFIMNRIRQKMVIASGAIRVLGTCKLSLTCLSTNVDQQFGETLKAAGRACRASDATRRAAK